MDLLHNIPKNLTDFLLVTVFSLLIGLSQRRLHGQAHDTDRTFGTDRTFTFIGILGFILYMLEPVNFYLFIGGGFILTVIIAISYFYHIRNFNDYGITTVLVAFITYCLGPLWATQPYWLVLLVVVVVLIVTELKESFTHISEKFDRNEFITLAKFLVIAGVILPMVPDQPFMPGLNLTPYKIWLAVVVISTISYTSYLLRKFVFKQASIIVSGILGGLYSSTATTIILAKKSAKDPDNRNQYVAGIIFALAMMYLRILILIFIFSQELFFHLWLFFIIMFLISTSIGLFTLFYKNKNIHASGSSPLTDKNPLEFKVAMIFTGLYIAFSFLTYFVLNRYGTSGLNVLSWLVGLTDIDPFLINLFQGQYKITGDGLAKATFQAIISNNILKLAYALFFGEKTSRKFLLFGFIIIIVVNIIFVWIV